MVRLLAQIFSKTQRFSDRYNCDPTRFFEVQYSLDGFELTNQSIGLFINKTENEALVAHFTLCQIV